MVASGSAWRRLRIRLPAPTAPTNSIGQSGRAAVARGWEAQPPYSEFQKLQTLVGNVLASCPDPLFVVDERGGIERANPAADALRARVGQEAASGTRIEPILNAVKLLTPGPDPLPFALRPVGDLHGLVQAREAPEEPIYDLRLTSRGTGDGASEGYLVQLVNVTPLLSALRGQQAANRHRDEFLKLLSHDLRSPHAAILATLNHADFASVPANLRQIIERAARRSLNMVDSLVRSVKAESSDYKLEPVALDHVLEEVVDSVWSRANESRIGINLELAEAESVVMVDRGMITRAMADILHNLIKFSVAGQPIGIQLRAGSMPSGPAVICEFSASVRQITNGELARIFSRFSGSQRAHVGSLGDADGLHLIQTVIERHHGSFFCSDPNDSLRRIRIVLPQAIDIQAESAQA